MADPTPTSGTASLPKILPKDNDKLRKRLEALSKAPKKTGDGDPVPDMELESNKPSKPSSTPSPNGSGQQAVTDQPPRPAQSATLDDDDRHESAGTDNENALWPPTPVSLAVLIIGALVLLGALLGPQLFGSGSSLPKVEEIKLFEKK